MPRFELTDELRADLGNQRESKACIHAKFLLTGTPHNECFIEAGLPADFDWKRDMTVWEIEIGQRLANSLRPEYKKEQAVLRNMKKNDSEKESA